MLKLLSNPNGFFSDLKKEEVKLKKPMAILIALAILLSAYQYILMLKLSQAFPPKLAVFFKMSAYFSIIGSLIGVFGVWLITAAIMHVVSALFNGKGSFRRTLEFVGYGFLPSLIGSLITFPMSAYYITNAEIPKIDIATFQQNPKILGALIASLIPKDVIYSNILIYIAMTIWSLSIWSFAIKHAREIELKKAFISALIPTVIFGIYQIWKFLKIL